VPAISNKTRKPLSIPLPGGKTLHLGPGKTGQIGASAVDYAQVRKLVEAGEIEVVSEDSRPADGPGGARRGSTSRHGYGSGSGSRRSGDR